MHLLISANLDQLVLLWAITEKNKRDIIKSHVFGVGDKEVHQFEKERILQWNLVERRNLIVLDSDWNILLIDPVKSEVTETWLS